MSSALETGSCCPAKGTQLQNDVLESFRGFINRDILAFSHFHSAEFEEKRENLYRNFRAFSSSLDFRILWLANLYKRSADHKDIDRDR